MVLTDNEKRELALEVLRILREQSIGINELPEAETMDGVNALPAYQTKDGEEKAVVVPIDLLGKPAIEAAAVANEVIGLARQTIADTEAAIDAADEATNSVNQSKQEAEKAAAAALAAASSVDESKAAAEEATDMAKKAAESAIRASDDADNVSSAVSEEWSGLKNEITQSTENAENGATLANEAVQKVNDFLAESGGKLITNEEREKLLNTYSKTETYSRPEIDAKNQETLDASREYATTRIAEMIGGAPEALDTLFEIAAALGNDPHFATSIMALLNGKADTEHRHSVSQITDFPTSLPASDVHPWAKQPTKPSYTAAEVGAAASNHNHDASYAPKTHEHDIIKGNYTGNGGQQAPSYVPSGKVRFNMMNTTINGDGSYKDFILMDTYSGSDVPVITGFGISKSTALRAFIMSGAKGGTSWARLAEIFTTANLNPADYAAANHNHDSSYAAKNHKHTADDITDTATKVMMTKAERSKLAGLEVPTILKNSNGYIKLGGIIIQWGKGGANTTDLVTINFPTAFPTACCSVVVSGIRNKCGGNGHNYVYNVTRTNFQATFDNSLGYFIAIGY